jgi:hypothetical protein
MTEKTALIIQKVYPKFPGPRATVTDAIVVQCIDKITSLIEIPKIKSLVILYIYINK